MVAAQALERRHGGVGRLGQHAVVEGQPAEIAVEKAADRRRRRLARILARHPGQGRERQPVAFPPAKCLTMSGSFYRFASSAALSGRLKATEPSALSR